LNKDITTFMASNINPDSVFNLMINLIKKLTLYYSLKESKDVRKKVSDYKKKMSFDSSATNNDLFKQAN